MIAGFFGTLLGVLSAIVGLFMLVLACALLVVHPLQLVWVLPLAAWFLVWAWRRIFPKRIVLHDRSLLYPPVTKDKNKRLVEPITMGGHTRHHEQDRHV